ncbi:hypothetical protein EH30_12935 [Erythrobacter sp. JL475]|nr:hypothetical protein EH30_12935 [Erythrobacter sp. JL475]
MIDKIDQLNCMAKFVDIYPEVFEDYGDDWALTDIPFPDCKIIEVSHSSFFAHNPHIPRHFELEGDKMLGRTAPVAPEDSTKTFWLPLSPQDNWEVILWKTDMLSALSGNRHHTNLEGFSVAGDILLPSFGS